MTRLYKFIGGAVALVLLAWAAKCGIERTVRNALQTDARRDSLTKDVAKTDSVFVVDTVRLRTVLPQYQTARRTLVITDTQRVRVVLELADSTIKACTQAVNSCAASLRARDSLIKELRKPPYVPRVTYVATLAYNPLTASALLRGGPEFRLFWGLSAVAEAEARQELATVKTSVRVGLQKRF